jgi:peroxisomal enoyl-CoA hydratase 2
MPNKAIDELEEMVGESKTTVTDLHIEAGKVEEFARAVKDDNPAHRDEDAAKEQGFEEIPAPMTFLMTSAFPRYKPKGVDEGIVFDLGFDMAKVLHGEQEYEFERPIYVGDTLRGETTLVDVYQREGERGGIMTFAIQETEYMDDNSDLVATERMTVIEQEG